MVTTPTNAIHSQSHQVSTLSFVALPFTPLMNVGIVNTHFPPRRFRSSSHIGLIPSLKRCKFSLLPILLGFFMQLKRREKSSTQEKEPMVDKEASQVVDCAEEPDVLPFDADSLALREAAAAVDRLS